MGIQPGHRLGHYELEHILGAGGMGTVFRAFDSRLHRNVAIKLLQPVLGLDGENQLLAEARAACALNHPNICTIHEVGQWEGQTFIVMEYIEGVALSERIAEGPVRYDLAMDLALQVAGALHHAHERSVAHGDLKSPNVLLTPAGLIKVVDFGLARRRAADEIQTQTIRTTGTPYAMAPEQLRGSPADLRTDVWSLGVLLQELFAGTRPFTRATIAELLAAILHEPPAPPPSHLPPGVRRIIERCLAREPVQRYQRAGEVLAALEAISDSGIALPGGPPAKPWTLAPPPAIANTGAGATAFVGRDEERRALTASWEQARAGRRQLVLLAGEPGIGKTRLATEFARSVSSEATVLYGRCDQEALIPHQPFVEALQWYARQCPAAVIDEHLSAVDGTTELSRLVPALGRRVPRSPEPAESNAESQRYRLFEAVAALISAMAAARPVLIVLEDLHWADRPTLLLLRHLLRSSHEAALGIIATYRETELGRTHPLAEILGDLRHEQGVVRLALKGLDAPRVRELIERFMGGEAPAALTRVVSENTEGNPFFITEVLRHLLETGALARAGTGAALDRELGLPEGVREAIGRRLARLSDPCNRVLALAAVIGREFSLTLLEAVSEVPSGQMLDVIDEALAARIVQDVPGAPGRFSFTHALVRDTLYGELTAARRARVHRAVADALERMSAGAEPPLADLAYHYANAAAAGEARKAIDYAERAAEKAASTFALEEAARFYQIALQTLELVPHDSALQSHRLKLHFKRGRAFADVGLWGAARQDLEAALALLDESAKAQRAELLLELSKCTFWLLDVPAVQRYSNEALQLAESLGRDDLAADAMSWIAGVLNSEGDVPAAVEMDRQAMARVGGPRTFGLARAVISLYHFGRISEAIERAFQALDSARTTQDPTFRVYALEHLAISLTAGGRYAEAMRTFEEMKEFGRRHGTLPMLARGMAMYAGLYISLGDYSRGEALTHEARELARRITFPPPFVSGGIDLLTIHARTHDPGRADRIFDDVARAVSGASGWHGWLWRLRMCQARAELAWARGEWQAALDAATEGVTESRARARPKYTALGLTTRARARERLDDVPGAIADATEAVLVARSLGDPAVLLRALTTRLDLDGTDALLSDAKDCVRRMEQQIDDAALRQCFRESELAAVSNAS